MADETPQALGAEEKLKFITITDTHPLPSNRKELVEVFQEILALGHVQKVTIELKKPIVFQRLVPENLVTEGQKPVEEDPLDGVRAGEVADFNSPKSSPYEVLYDAFERLGQFEPKLIVVGNYGLVRKWLKLPHKANLDRIYGVKTAQSSNMPEDVIVLAGVHSSDPEHIVYSLRIAMEVER